MKTLTLTLAATVVLGALGFAAPASAAVTTPAGVSAETSMVEHVAMRRHHMMKRDRHMRRMMRRNSRMKGDPNARNPERPGYMQQKGNTSGGPRY
ncbi:hypothetical protein [Methylobacterium oryzihabitans]|uniref:Uncharacterized protein n=1 Tax=Methylobacterium oryzihabitans TaxID=2499852 RepID=A0A437P7B2_9HYPH|nr:hypothetical protein [Methylobacterium oryzihabitans]RVU18112.1 hypothetical protein EOE48_12015 [Methylobacterium oryzihabitans]